MQQQQWMQLLPFAIIALILWRRWKNLGVAKPLSLKRLVIAPLVYAVLVGFIFRAMPPSIGGWEVFALGVVIAGLVGWQRARLMHLHRDEATGQIMQRQSAAGLAVFIGIFLLRRVFVPSGSDDAVVQGAHPALPLLTDALLGFALGVIVGYRIELWRRARALTPAG